MGPTMISPNVWFHKEGKRHKSADEVMKEYEFATSKNLNYCLNIGLRGDGSIHPDDERVLREVGGLLKQPDISE